MGQEGIPPSKIHRKSTEKRTMLDVFLAEYGYSVLLQNAQKNGGRSALYFIPFGVSKIRQSTGKISCGAKILNHQISGRSTMDTGSYSKTKKKWRAFRPVFYTCWGVGNRAEYRKNKLWRQNLNPQNQRAFHRVLYISVCSFIYILLLCLLYIYIYIYSQCHNFKIITMACFVFVRVVITSKS